MSIGNVLTSSLSGLTAQAHYLGDIANNISNSNTIGYKASLTDFSTLVDESGGEGADPGGVSVSTRFAVAQQGVLETTTSPTDLAIQGNGFFVVSQPSGPTELTRAGSFVPDSSGYLVNTAGLRLMGYGVGNANQAPVANGTAGLVPITVNMTGQQATATTAGKLTMNLPAANPVNPGPLPSTNSATASYDAKTSLVAYDSLGAPQTIDLYTAKTASNTWELTAFDRSTASAGGGFPYGSGPLASMTLNFDPTNGALANPSPQALSISIPNGQTLNLDLSGTTQLASNFNVEAATVNGNAPSSVASLNISSSGQVYEVYQNGAQTLTYQIPLATVTSPDNLTAGSGNAYTVGPESGNIQIGTPGTSGFGVLASKSLEQSTIDVSQELTNMIEAQRNYTANSKVLQTGATMLDTIMNIIR